jgi:hypothetical protein
MTSYRGPPMTLGNAVGIGCRAPKEIIQEATRYGLCRYLNWQSNSSHAGTVRPAGIVV